MGIRMPSLTDSLPDESSDQGLMPDRFDELSDADSISDRYPTYSNIDSSPTLIYLS